MTDDVLGKLREARALLLDERDAGKNSRELSITLTEVETAILWRQHDLQLKAPVKNHRSGWMGDVSGGGCDPDVE